jgi:hypothetical protein
MITYAERVCFVQSEIATWTMACTLVQRVKFDECRCHELARAVLFALGGDLPMLFVQDGKVGPVEHTWLRFEATGNILDVYRPGVLPGVLLIDGLLAGDYKAGTVRDDIRQEDLLRILQDLK